MFFVIIIKSSSFRIGFQVQLVFQISQHNRDEELMRSLISYFGCGFIVKNSRASWVEFIVCKFSDISGKIFPFFRDHKVRGVKAKDFQDWCEVLEIIQAKAHLTERGLARIR